jgi:uncharacterized protein YegJ (DUF2314 family)
METPMRALALATILLLSLVPAAQAQDPIVQFADDDPEMVAAMDEAVQSLPRFLTEALGPDGQSLDGTAIKVRLDADGSVPGMTHEIIWVSPFARLDGGFAGLLANDPQALGGLVAGDRVDFAQDQIVDWSYSGPDGKLYGNFTTRVMVPHLSADEAAWLNDALSELAVPDFWTN